MHMLTVIIMGHQHIFMYSTKEILIAGFFRHAHGDHVGAGADHGAVAAQARPQRQGPPQHVVPGQAEALAQEQHDGQHGGGEGDVVDEGRGNGRDPEDHDHGDGQVALGER